MSTLQRRNQPLEDFGKQIEIENDLARIYHILKLWDEAAQVSGGIVQADRFGWPSC